MAIFTLYIELLKMKSIAKLSNFKDLVVIATQRVAKDISVRQSVSQSCISCQRNSSETAQKNFVKLCIHEGHNV